MTSPQSVGYSSERLRTIDQFFEREIERNRVPGAVVAIARDGQLVYYKALGFRSEQKGTAMTTDTIFPLASMTKIMTAVGALTLTEKGRLPLYSPLADYYPDFANMKVGVKGGGGQSTLEPPKRQILIHDLMRHTSGLTYGGRPDGSSFIAAQYPQFRFGGRLHRQDAGVPEHDHETAARASARHRVLGLHLSPRVWCGDREDQRQIRWG